MDISVRKARVADVAQIVALAKLRDGAKKDWPVGRRRGFTLQLRHLIANSDTHLCWVALDEAKRVVGYAFASFTYSPIDDGMWLHVAELYVRPRLRSSGVGGRLMRAMKAASTRAKAKGVWLVVHPNNTDAQRFYRRNKMRMRVMKSCAWAA
ncbi:MAG: GNAT family N-acetyltransferase [Pseudomonadaceae bacterium]|nr:GNAT family N-acetyltransferase [Pseudomonadaceae bacterium]